MEALRLARTQAGPLDGATAGQQPTAFGPWQVVGAHPTRPWAWGARHEKTGERAVVEVCFAPTAEVGDTLRRAVEVNPALVPLGAERLLGTNRLILRPGEAWGEEPPSGPFAFWVAREELPTPEIAPLGEAEIQRTLQSVLALQTTAKATGVALDLGPTALVALPDGSIHLRRPGLPLDTKLDPDAAALDSIRKLPLDVALTATVARAPSLAALGRDLRVAGYAPAEYEKTVVLPPSEPDAGGAAATPAPSPAPAAATQPAGIRQRRRRMAIALFAGVIVVALVAAAAYGAFLSGGSHPSPSGLIAGVASTTTVPGQTVEVTVLPNGSVLVAEVPLVSGSGSPAASGQPGSIAPVSGSTHAPGAGSTPTPAPTPTPHPTPTTTPTPSPTPTPVPYPDLVVSTDPAVSSDGVAHGSSQPFKVPLNAVYNNVTVQAGAYMSANGMTLAFSAYGTVTVAGVITMDGHGYAGGSGGNRGSHWQGDSYTGIGHSDGHANGGGGGGGECADCGGGGGGYGTAGAPGGKPSDNGTLIEGGGTYGDSSLSTLYPGSGGGCSGSYHDSSAAGGAGGGIINITAASIVITGAISANGHAGASVLQQGSIYDGGGGGSGGSVLLTAGSFAGSSLVTASGGAGGYGQTTSGPINGGAGGAGRIRFLHS